MTYSDYPGHPLARVPLTALEAGRAALRDAVVSRDVTLSDPADLEPIADAVLAAAYAVAPPAEEPA